MRLALELLIYNLVLLPLLLIAVGWFAWRIIVLHKPIGRLIHRLGFVPAPSRKSGPRIWLHAASAGEMTAARPVLAELRRRFPEAAITLSTHTNTGMEIAQHNCGDADAIFYFTFDLPTTVGLAMLRVRPNLVVIVEKELWPNFLGIAHLFGAKVLAVNGRVSDRMVRRARILPAGVRWLYRLVDAVCVQSEEDRRRLAALGVGDAGESRLKPAAPTLGVTHTGDSTLKPAVPSCQTRVVLAGNTKVDILAARDVAAEDDLRKSLSISDSEVWLVAGSTHPGEEEQIVDAYIEIREMDPSARLLLAPRHLERLPDVSAMLAQRGLQVIRRSEGRHDLSDAVVVLDTMGELRAAYALATVAFVGGTFVPIGGHNLLEPVAVGIPVLFGPHTENCADMADLVLHSGVGFQVTGTTELAEGFLRLARNSELRGSIAARADELMAAQRGASARCAAMAEELLAGQVRSDRSDITDQSNCDPGTGQ